MKQTSNNSFCCLIDWLSFTFPVCFSLNEIISFLCIDYNDLILSNGGGYGYKSQYIFKSSNIRIYFDGNDNMGVHIQVSGSAISYFVSLFKRFFDDISSFSDEEIFRYILSLLIDLDCNFTRFDLSLDDKGNNFFSPDDIITYFENGQISTRYKKFNITKSQSTKDKKTLGNTVYFGSRSGGSYLRIYDKQLEQNDKLSEDNKIDYPWTRWEFEFKKKHAHKLVTDFISGMSLNTLFFSVLGHMIRIHLNDDSNISRCSVLPLWEKFISSARSFSFCFTKPADSLEKTEKYIIRQAMPSIFKLISVSGRLPLLSKKQFEHIINNCKSDSYWGSFFSDDTVSYLESEFLSWY